MFQRTVALKREVSFLKKFMNISLIYNVVIISAVQESDSLISLSALIIPQDPGSKSMSPKSWHLSSTKLSFLSSKRSNGSIFIGLWPQSNNLYAFRTSVAVDSTLSLSEVWPKHCVDLDSASEKN